MISKGDNMESENGSKEKNERSVPNNTQILL